MSILLNDHQTTDDQLAAVLFGLTDWIKNGYPTGEDLGFYLSLGTDVDPSMAVGDARQLLESWYGEVTSKATKLQPDRVNFAGYCVMCFDRGCESQRCIGLHEGALWEICRTCEGTGLDPVDGICDCIGGLVDMTHSMWVNRPRSKPPRLNFAGLCIYCDGEWCEAEPCIELHDQTRWKVCVFCDGRGYLDDDSSCGCAYGLMEASRRRAAQ